TARWLVPRLLEAMAELHPKVHLIVIDGVSTSLEPQLITGHLDLAVVNLPPDPFQRPYNPGSELMARPLFDEDLLLVVPAQHRLAANDVVRMADTDGLELLLPAPGTAFREEIDEAVATGGVRWTPKAEIDGLRLIASLTFEGLGPAILPATAIPDVRHAEWRAVTVEGLPCRSVGI